MSRIISDGKKNAINELIKEYDVKTIKDLHEAFKDLFGDTIQGMLEAEFDLHMEHSNNSQLDGKKNYRNGKGEKTLKSTHGTINIDVPRDRNSEFEPKIVPKRKRDISDIEEKIIAMYGNGMSTRQISEQIDDIYGFDVSADMISAITDKIIPEIEEWHNRALDEVYPIIFIDAIHFSVRSNGLVTKKAAYVVLGVTKDGRKEVLDIFIGENESAKFWLGVLNSLKNRGVKDILIICADGLKGIKEAIEASFPNTEYQRCIVHQIRNTLKYVTYTDRKAFAGDLKSIYTAANEKEGYEQMLKVNEKWESKYPNSMKSWYTNWEVICPFFKFGKELRKIMYTTNAIGAL